MSIVQITEQEQRLTNTLRQTTEALKQVTAERDAQRKVLEQALELLKEAVMSKGLIKTVQALSCANAAIANAKEKS